MDSKTYILAEYEQYLPNNITCTASSVYDARFTCKNLIDNNQKTSWVSNGEGIGAWVKLEFLDNIHVKGLKFSHRRDTEQAFKDIQIEFPNGLKYNRTLANQTAPIDIDADSNGLVGSVNITAVDVWGDIQLTINNGYEDIEVYISEKGKNDCSNG